MRRIKRRRTFLTFDEQQRSSRITRDSGVVEENIHITKLEPKVPPKEEDQVSMRSERIPSEGQSPPTGTKASSDDDGSDAGSEEKKDLLALMGKLTEMTTKKLHSKIILM